MKLGDIVHIKSLNREGTILELLPKDKVRVSVGTLKIIVNLTELTLSLKKPSDIKKDKVTITRTSTHSKEKEELDLHGYTVDQAIELLERKLNSAILSKLGRIKVVHGFGSGRVMSAVHQYLSTSPLVSNYRVDDLNPGQTWVWI